MRSVKKIVAAVVIAGVACQILPVEAIAAQLNTVAPPEAFGALPNDSQVQYHEEELAAFIHFGMNTFTNSEWGNGRENPNSFNPTDLNTDEWVRVLKEAGFKRVILVGKHHDGFCLWPSKVTEHDVESSTDWQASQGGNGDVLAALSESCTKYDMDMGIYLSPWDANAESYGYGTGTDDATDTNGDYNEYYMTQLREILGNPKYGNNGKFVEVWMDGAKGSGAAAQQYKFDDWFNLIEELQPGALVFSPYGTGIRWIGNESGRAGDPAWSKVNLKRIRDRYDAGYGDEQAYLNNGDPEGDIWSVGECDVSLTSGWFWHNGNGPKSMEQLTNIYFSSVGRGQPLLLNVAPDNTGNFTAEDIERLQEFAAAINNSFDENLAGQSTVTAEASEIRGNSNDYSPANVLDDDDDSYWTMNDGQTTGSLTINLGEEKVFDIVSIEEYIKLGQRISEFSVEVSSDGQNWKKFGEGYTIGAKRLVRGTPVTASQIRINIEGSLAVPLIENVEVYKADEAFEMESIVPLGTEFIDNVQFDNKDAWTQESIGINSTGMYTSSAGVHSSFTFTGTKAWVIGTLDPNHGIMEVWIDGEKVDEVDTYKATRSISQILYTTDDLAYGEHTVKIVVKGEKNAAARGQAIGLDGAYYLNNNGAGMFEIENTSYNVNEGDSIDVTIKRVGGSTGEATVHFSTSPDSAVHGRHYQDVNTIVEFADGQDTATVSIPTIDNTEKSGNLKFYCNIDTPTNSSIIGFNKKTEVTIIDNDMEQEIDEPYTEERPFIFPNKADEAKVLEAEHFTLEAIEGDKYVRITEDSQASNGKKVGWFEPGNKIKVPFFTKRAGVYTVNVTYQSGRSEGNLNKLNWSGTNVVEGSVSVPGTGNQQPIPFINTSFDIEITEAGAGELIFTADSQASPNIDFFEIVPKELEAGPHGEENPIILSDDEVIIEAETLELDGQGGEIESKDGASEGKLVGWLGKTTRGNAWLNMWLNSDKSAEYDIEVKYFAGANNVLYYENIDGSVSGSIECPTTSPNFSTVKFRVSLNEGLDRIKFFNNDASTVNIDTIKITKVEEEVIEEQTGINMTVAEEVTVGNDFGINVNLSDIKENMYAMEFEVDYDETKVDFKEATSVDADKYFVQAKATDGKVKVVVAGLGIALENVKDIVKLTFTAKASGENIAFDLINGKVADGEGAEEATKTS
ncbi:alpha-L-fucosidase, partial [Clostridium celatum]|uniref:alpha-L-fucosidase n=1 Tax=Clostridium celatum TaxID=36834 RepID=UPI001899A784